MRLKIIILLIQICLFSCRKAGKGYVRGTVYESGSSIVIPNAIVYLGSTKKVDGFKFLDSTVTNSRGEYYLKYSKNFCDKYFVNTREPSNYFGSDNKEITYKKSALNLELYPKAYLKIRIKKTSSSLNSITYRVNGVNSNILIEKPYPFDTLIPIKYAIYGNKFNDVSWIVYSPIINAPHSNFNETVYVNKNDTLTYTITYN